MSVAERIFKAVLAAAAVSYIVSCVFRDYWSALSSAVLTLTLAIIIVERRCRRWCRSEESSR